MSVSTFRTDIILYLPLKLIVVGFFFQIKDNIQQIFGKFLNEGKATIRFKEPEQDLCISKVQTKLHSMISQYY